MEIPLLHRNIIRTAFAALLLVPGLAAARDTCGGTNILPALEAERPGAVAAMRAAADAAPNPRGRFWRIDAPGAAPSHIFGTLHGTADEGITAPASVLAAIRASRVMFIEITEDEQAAMQAAISDDVNLIVDMRGGTLDAALPPALRETAARILPDYGLTYRQANVLRPWFLQVALATPPCAMAAMAAGAEALDHVIAGAAKADGIPVRGLETWRDALDFFMSQPEDEALDGIAQAVAMASMAEDMRATMRDLYLADELMMIWELSRDISAALIGQAEADKTAAAAWDGMVVARNEGFLAGAADDLATGGAFIAVGGLHLPGDGGMIQGLRALGYAVTPLPLD